MCNNGSVDTAHIDREVVPSTLDELPGRGTVPPHRIGSAWMFSHLVLPHYIGFGRVKKEGGSQTFTTDK